MAPSPLTSLYAQLRGGQSPPTETLEPLCAAISPSPSAPSTPPSPSFLSFLRAYRHFFLSLRCLSNNPQWSDFTLRNDDVDITKVLYTYLQYAAKAPHDVLSKAIPSLRSLAEASSASSTIALHLILQIAHRVGEAETIPFIITALTKQLSPSPSHPDDLELECNLLSSYSLSPSPSVLTEGIEFVRRRLAASDTKTFEWLFDASIVQLAANDMKGAIATLQKAISVGRESMRSEGMKADEIEQEVAVAVAQMAFVYHLAGIRSESIRVLSSLPPQIVNSSVSSVVAVNADLLFPSTHHSFGSLKKSTRALHLDEEKLNPFQRAIINSNRIALLWRGKQYEKSKAAAEKIVSSVGQESIEATIIRTFLKWEGNKGGKEAMAELDEYIGTHRDNPTKSFIPYIRDVDLAMLCKAHLLIESNNVHDAINCIKLLEDKIRHAPSVVSWRVMQCEDEADAEKVISESLQNWKSKLTMKNADGGRSLSPVSSPLECLLTLFEFQSTFYIRHLRFTDAAKSIDEMEKVQRSVGEQKDAATKATASVETIPFTPSNFSTLRSQCRRVELSSLVSSSPLRALEASKALPDVTSSAQLNVDDLIAKGINAEPLKKKKGRDKEKEQSSKEKAKREKRRRKRRLRLPKNIKESTRALHPVDAQRWLPKYERDSYRQKKSKSKKWRMEQKRKQKAQAQSLRGAQGDASVSVMGKKDEKEKK